MSFEKWKTALQKALSKDRTVKLLVFLGVCGVALLTLSTVLEGGGKEKKPEAPAQSLSARTGEAELERELERIVAAITGEESPAVLVTLENNGRTVYASDEKSEQRDRTSGENSLETQTSHVILKSSDGGQQALAVTEITPKIKGVVIVSKRAGDPVIREKLTEAVRTALNISSARVCVTDSG